MITPNTVTINGATTVVDSTISPGGSAPAGGSAGTGGSNQNANSGSGGDSGGLSTGAKAGIGAGVGGGALIIAFILGFCLWRRRKSKNEQNQEMIQNAVDSAMATHVARNSVPSVPPVSYYDGKHMSTSTYSAPPSHPTSPSPQIHAPQPGYVYPPPQGHGQPMYSTDPMNFPEAMGSQPRYNYSAPLYGTEVAGSPVQQRHELASINSPAPPQPSVPYSNLPEVRR